MATQNRITEENFWKTSVFFFTQKRPDNLQTYMHGYGLASNAWFAFKDRIDGFNISSLQKNDLIKLFDLAEDYFYYLNSEEYSNYHDSFLIQKWSEMNQLANRLYQKKKFNSFFQNSPYGEIET